MQTIKNLLKYSVWAGLFMVPFIHFIVSSTMFFPFITGKGFTFRILIEIVAGLYLMLAVIEPAFRPKMSWITKSVIFFVLAVLVADIFSANPYKSFWSNYERMEGFVLIAHLALYYIVASSVFDRKRWSYFLNTSIVASALVSIYGILQIAGKITINQGGVRVDGTFGNATYFAIYLVFHIFLCLYMLVQNTRATWQKWSYGLIALLELVVLYYTATRGAILGLIGGLILAGLILVIKEKENLKLKRIGYGAIAFVVVLVGVFIGIRQTAFVQNSPVLSRFASLSTSEIKTQGRYFVWPMAIKGFLERPVFGWGQESFNFVFNKYYDPRMYGQEQWFDRTHDIFLDWLIAGGIVGLLAYLSLYAALLYYIWKRTSSISLAERSILIGMVAAYMFHNIFVFDNLISYIMFFSVLAYIHSLNVEGETSNSAFYTKTFSAEVSTYVAIPVIAIATVACVYFVNVPAILANKTLIKAMTPQSGGVSKNLEYFKQVFSYNSFGNAEAVEQLVQAAVGVAGSQVSEKDKQDFIVYAKQKIDEKIAQSPNDARYLMFAGSFLNRIGQYDEAIKYLERAIKASPNKQTIYFELASSYLGKKNTAKVAELLKKAYDLEPDSKESQVLYAVSAIYTNNQVVLKEMAQKLGMETLLNDNRIIQAYAGVGDIDSVILILSQRIKANPSNVDNYKMLAYYYLTSGQKQKAIETLRSAIAKNPGFKQEAEVYIQQIQAQ